MDADLVITNSTVRLESYIGGAVASRPDGSVPDVMFSDGTEVNSGAFFVRSTAWSAKFLQQWWDVLPPHVLHGSYYDWLFEQVGAIELTLQVGAEDSGGVHTYARGTCLHPSLDTFVKVNTCWRLEMARMGLPHCNRASRHVHFYCGDTAAARHAGAPQRGFNQKNGVAQPVYAQFYRPHEVWRPGDFTAHIITARELLPLLQLYAPAALFRHAGGTCPWQAPSAQQRTTEAGFRQPAGLHWAITLPDRVAVCEHHPPCPGDLWVLRDGWQYTHFNPWVNYSEPAPPPPAAPLHHLRVLFAQADEDASRPAVLHALAYLPSDDVWSRHSDFCVFHAMDCAEGWANFLANPQLVHRVTGPAPHVYQRTGLPDDAGGAAVAPLPGAAAGDNHALQPLVLRSPRDRDVLTCCCCTLELRLQRDFSKLTGYRRHLLATLGNTSLPLPPADGPPSGAAADTTYFDQSLNVHGTVCVRVKQGPLTLRKHVGPPVDGDSTGGGAGADTVVLVDKLCVDPDGRDLVSLQLRPDVWRPSDLTIAVWWQASDDELANQCGDSADMRMLTEAHARVHLDPLQPSGVEMLWTPFPSAAASGEVWGAPEPTAEARLPAPPRLRPAVGINASDFLTSQDAFVTLVWSDAYVEGVVTLAQSLRDVGSTQLLVVLVGCHLNRTLMVSPSMVEWMVQQPNTHVVAVEELPTLAPASRMPRLGSELWMKLRLWQLTKYRCLAFLDADSLVLTNIDHLLLLCNPNALAALRVFPASSSGDGDGGSGGDGSSGGNSSCGSGVGTPLLEAVLTPEKWLNFTFAGVSTIPSEYRNAHTISGMFVARPSLVVWQEMVQQLHETNTYAYGESAFLDKFFELHKVVLPHTLMCLAEGMDWFYADHGRSCEVVDFQSCGRKRWKPWHDEPPPTDTASICRFPATQGYMAAASAWRRTRSRVPGRRRAVRDDVTPSPQHTDKMM